MSLSGKSLPDHHRSQPRASPAVAADRADKPDTAHFPPMAYQALMAHPVAARWAVVAAHAGHLAVRSTYSWAIRNFAFVVGVAWCARQAVAVAVEGRVGVAVVALAVLGLAVLVETGRTHCRLGLDLAAAGRVQRDMSACCRWETHSRW